MSVAVVALLALILGVGVAGLAGLGICIFIINGVKEMLEFATPSDLPVIPAITEIDCETT